MEKINFTNGHDWSALAQWIRKKPMISAVLSGLAILWFFGATLGSGQSQGSGRASRGSSKAAIEQFWTIFHGNDYGAIAGVQAELQAALEHDPENVTLYGLLGATHF